ncbi:hypothetical protein C5708_16565 [Caulobacter sp. CCUG 60055]|uniref:YbaY family lipoprotein n=1 Tax=Caulobacter sp. CCUG 60055 TaxID=2100090 RepID=UPI001FA7E77B|nr:YbaY family lipoprotein [Caulobacter sp. CCUG 60055]MCI3181859.1 hypothetical protein [Caulobacter sp. CCUG 60055]
MKLPRVLVPVAALTALAACETAAPPPAKTAAVTGSVTYRERILLAPPARVTVTLSDVSLMDAPSKTIATQTIDGVQSGPVNFRLDYDPARIVPNHDYAVSARFEVGGKLRFITDTRYSVITRGAPTRVDMVAVAVTPSP